MRPFSRTFDIASGLVSLVLIVAGITVVIQVASGAYAGGYKVNAVFERTVAGVDSRTDVKVRGINVGRVDKVELEHAGRVVVTLRLNEGVRVPDTATLSMEPLSVFGPKFVNLVPGDHETTGPYLEPGGTIAHTVRPGEFLDTLDATSNLLKSVDLDELATIFTTVSGGLDGLGPDVGQIVDAGATLTDLAARHTDDFSILVRDLATLSTTLADRGDELTAIAADLRAVVPELTSRPESLSTLLDTTTDMASRLAQLLGDHGGAIDATITGAGNLADALYAGRGGIPDYFGSAATLAELIIGGLNPIGDGRLMLSVRGYVQDNLCFITLGVACPTSTSAGATGNAIAAPGVAPTTPAEDATAAPPTTGNPASPPRTNPVAPLTDLLSALLGSFGR